MCSPRVGVAGETDELLHIVGGRDLQAALSQERLFREKVEGVWLYGSSQSAIASARSAVNATLRTTLRQWFLAPTHPLAGYLAKTLTAPAASKNVVRAFIREALRRDEFLAVATLTNDFEPYLALLLEEDEAEIERQLETILGVVASRGRCRAADLPPPCVDRAQNAWRWTALQHAEYLGLGYIEDRALVRWA